MFKQLMIVLGMACAAIAAPADEWKPLFNGKDLDGWQHVGKGSMSVEGGLIETHSGMGLLYWKGGKIGNCVLRVVYKMRDHNDNSGVYVRIPVEPREPWMPVHYGYEVQIDNEPEKSNEDDYHVTGTLYSLTKPLAKPGKPGPEWNTMEITLDGPRTDCGVERREGYRLYRRTARSTAEVRFRTAPGTEAARRLVRITEPWRA